MTRPERPSPRALKVADVARRAGVSVRTLHYYEEIGLLKPSARTSAGHRLYRPEDIQRLQQIRSLQQLGLPLSEVSDCLDAGRIDARRVVADHLQKVERERAALEGLERQLRALAGELERGGTDGANTETLLNALEMITMYEKYFTPDQQARLASHQATGDELVTATIIALDEARQKGVDPSDPEARRLLSRFEEAIDAVADGDPSMVKAIQELLHAEPKAREDHGISESLFAYLGEIAGGDEHAQA